MTNEVSTLGTVTQSIPWSEVFAWITGTLLPVVIALWRKQAASSAVSAKVLSAVIQGVEAASSALNPSSARIVKQEIRDASIDNGVQRELDNHVQTITKPNL